MKVCIISDTHGLLPEVPDSDILIHCGDFTPHLNFNDQLRWLRTDFRLWLEKLNRPTYINFGNHELLFEKFPYLVPPLPCKFLKDQQVNIADEKVWFSPWILPIGEWAFMQEEDGLDFMYKQIPVNTTIVVSHCPPYNYGDLTIHGDKIGTKSLVKHTKRLKNLKYVFTGHCHEGYGQYKLNNVDIFNCSLLNENYKLANPSTIIEL